VQYAGTLAGQVLEPMGIDSQVVNREQVSGPGLLDDLVPAEGATQPGYQRLQRVGHVGRRILPGPHGIDELCGGHGARGIDREPGQQPSYPCPGDRDERTVHADLELAQDGNVHPSTLPDAGRGLGQTRVGKRLRLRARALSASTARSRGLAVVTSASSRRWVAAATSATARSTASVFAFDGFCIPLTLRTYWVA